MKIIFLLLLIVAALLQPAVAAASYFIDLNSITISDYSVSSSKKDLPLKKLPWTVPHNSLGYFQYTHIGAGKLGTKQDWSLPAIDNLELLLRIPTILNNRLILVNSFENKDMFFSYHNQKTETYQRQLSQLYFFKYSLTLRIVQNQKWQHVITAGTGYGGDYNSFSSDGMVYMIGYNAFWNNGKNLQIGFGAALTKVNEYYVPIPTLILTWEIKDNLLYKAILPQKMLLRYSMNRNVLAGLFLRLNAGKYFLGRKTDKLENYNVEMNDGIVRMIRVDFGAEFQVRIWKPIYLKFEGGVSGLKQVDLPDLSITEKSTEATEIDDQYFSAPQKIAGHISWFAGLAVEMLF